MELARLRWGIGTAIVITTVALGLWRVRTRTDHNLTPGIPGELVTLEVEVLNATSIDGLARRVTRFLRQRGIDVVFYGSERPGAVSVTTIIVRRGDSTVAVPVRSALGMGRIVVEATDGTLLDVSVLLGPDAAGLGSNP